MTNTYMIVTYRSAYCELYLATFILVHVSCKLLPADMLFTSKIGNDKKTELFILLTQIRQRECIIMY